MKHFGLGLVGATLQGGYLLAPAVVDSVESTGLRLRAVRETNHEAAREVERNTAYGYSTHDIQQEVYLTREIDHLLYDGMLDGMLVTAPAAQHRELLENACAGDKKIVLQAPLADTLEQARAIADACAQQDILVNLPRRFDAGWQKAHELLRSGIIGKLQFINLRACLPETNYLRLWERTQEGSDDLFLAQLSGYMDVFNWFADAPCLHVAGIGDESDHDLDNVSPSGVFHGLFRQLPLRWRVKVSPHTPGIQNDDFPTDHYLDHAAIQLLFSSNLIGTLNIANTGTAAQDVEELELVGEKGRIWFNALNGTMTVQWWDNTPAETIDNLGPHGLSLYQRYNQALIAQLPDFLEGASPKATVQHACDALEMVCAALESIHNNGLPVLLEMPVDAEPLPVTEEPPEETADAITEPREQAAPEDSPSAAPQPELDDICDPAWEMELAQMDEFSEESEADFIEEPIHEIEQESDADFEALLLHETEPEMVEDSAFLETLEEEMETFDDDLLERRLSEEIEEQAAAGPTPAEPVQEPVPETEADPHSAVTQAVTLPQVDEELEIEPEPAAEPQPLHAPVLESVPEPDIFAAMFTRVQPKQAAQTAPAGEDNLPVDAVDAVPQAEFTTIDAWEDDHPAVEDITETTFAAPEPPAPPVETAPSMVDWTEDTGGEATEAAEETPPEIVQEQPAPPRTVDWPAWLETGFRDRQPAQRTVDWPAWLETGFREKQPQPPAVEWPAWLETGLRTDRSTDTTAQWPAWLLADTEPQIAPEPAAQDAFVEADTAPTPNPVPAPEAVPAEEPAETVFADLHEPEAVLEILEIDDFIIVDDETAETLETDVFEEEDAGEQRSPGKNHASGAAPSPQGQDEDAIIESPSVVISEKIHLDDFIWDIVPLEPFRPNADPRTGDAWEEAHASEDSVEAVVGDTVEEPLADAPLDSVSTFHHTTAAEPAFYEADTQRIDLDDLPEE